MSEADLLTEIKILFNDESEYYGPGLGTWLLECSMFIYKLGSEVRAQIVVSTPPRHDFENVGPFGYTFFRTCSLQWGVNPVTMFPPLKCKWDPATAQLKHCTPWSTAPFLGGHETNKAPRHAPCPLHSQAPQGWALLCEGERSHPLLPGLSDARKPQPNPTHTPQVGMGEFSPDR